MNVKECFACISTNMIYAITCTRCERIYIGETKRHMADRFTEHIRLIKINLHGLPIAAKLYSSDQSIFKAMFSAMAIGLVTHIE